MIQRLNDRMHRSQERGLTLIELLIVIVILGILSAIVVFSVAGINDKGEDSACAATASAVLTASEAAYAQNGTYPADNGGLAGFITWPSNVDHSAGNVIKYPATGTAKWTVTWTAGVAPTAADPDGTSPTATCS